MEYGELVELAQLCARNAHAATSDDVIQALWRMAKEYRAQAAALGAEPNIGDPPAEWGASLRASDEAAGPARPGRPRAEAHERSRIASLPASIVNRVPSRIANMR